MVFSETGAGILTVNRTESSRWVGVRYKSQQAWVLTCFTGCKVEYRCRKKFSRLWNDGQGQALLDSAVQCEGAHSLAEGPTENIGAGLATKYSSVPNDLD